MYNVLIADERSEIAACYNGVPQLDVGAHTDIISNCSKAYAFEQGIRAMRPDIIITDEIANIQDIASIQYALSAGVVVIASIHARDIADIPNKAGFVEILQKSLFERYIVLSNKGGPGTLAGVYDGRMVAI
jgi:stage III sporulation protein AA